MIIIFRHLFNTNINRLSTMFIKILTTQQNKSTIKWITAGIAIFGIAFLAKSFYSMLTHPSSSNQNTKIKVNNLQKRTERLNTKGTQYSEYYFDKDQEIKMIESCLSDSPSVEEIYLHSPLIARDQFVKYTREIRKRRRLIRKTSQDQYINTILTYQSEVYELLYRSRSQLIEALNMDQQKFAQMEQNYQALDDLSALSQKSLNLLKQKLITQTKRKPMSIQKLKQILQEQMHFIKNKMYSRIRQNLQNQISIRQDQILVIVENLLEDIVYQKFGYEQEDVLKKMEQIGFDGKELRELRDKMRLDIAEFNFDSVNSDAGDSQKSGYQAEKSAKTLYRSQDEQSDQLQ